MTSLNLNNKNISNISINNNEISTITIDNKTIYEKDAGLIITLQNKDAEYDITETIPLSAIVTDSNENPIENVSVTFEVRKSNSLLTTLTDTTDSNGVASVSYSNNSYNELNITAKINNRNVSDISSIYVYKYYDSAQINKTSNYTKIYISGANKDLRNNEVWYYINGKYDLGYGEYFFAINQLTGETNPLSVEMKVKGYPDHNFGIGFAIYNDSDNYIIFASDPKMYYIIDKQNGVVNETSAQLSSQLPYQYSVDFADFKLIINESIEYYLQGNGLIETINIPSNFITSSTKYGIYGKTSGASSIGYKDLKIRLIE